MSAMAITKVRLVIFYTRDFDFYCVPAHDSTLVAQRTSHASNSLSTQTEILNFLVNQVSCDEYCAVIGTHSMVHGDELLYGHVQTLSLGAATQD